MNYDHCVSRPGIIAGPLHSTPLQINSQSIPRLDPIDSKSEDILANEGEVRLDLAILRLRLSSFRKAFI